MNKIKLYLSKVFLEIQHKSQIQIVYSNLGRGNYS